MDSPEDVWRLDWHLGPEPNVYASRPFSGLGKSDGIFLYDETKALIASITYGDSARGFSNAWDTDGAPLGTSMLGEYGAWQSSNLSPDIASPGHAHVAPEIAQPLATLL